jgi:putative DNA-binding protein
VRPPALRDVQAAFWRSLAGATDPELLRVVEPTARLTAAGRIGVYQDMYLGRLADVLGEDFPKLAGLLGHEAFVDLVREYVAAHPSRHPSIRHVGRALPEFLAVREPPWLADVARLECARLDAFDAPDATPLAADALRRIPPPEWAGLRLVFVPALECLVTEWPVHVLWKDPPEPLVACRSALRVWRQDFLVWQTAMDAAEEAALVGAMAGEPFAAMCDVVDDAADAAAMLLRWIEDGLVAAVGTDPRGAGRT